MDQFCNVNWFSMYETFENSLSWLFGKDTAEQQLSLEGTDSLSAQHSESSWISASETFTLWAFCLPGNKWSEQTATYEVQCKVADHFNVAAYYNILNSQRCPPVTFSICPWSPIDGQISNTQDNHVLHLCHSQFNWTSSGQATVPLLWRLALFSFHQLLLHLIAYISPHFQSGANNVQTSVQFCVNSLRVEFELPMLEDRVRVSVCVISISCNSFEF